MTAKPLKTGATYEDLWDVPENYVAEIFDGELYASPRPAPAHARAGSGLVGELWGSFGRGRNGPGGWIILYEPELHFGKDIVVPDIAGWRRSRMSEMPTDAYFTLAPDWICEVLSPSTESIDRGKKVRIYARERVGHAWLLDPLRRTLEVLSLESGQWTPLATHEGLASARAEPFAALELELAVLWT